MTKLTRKDLKKLGIVNDVRDRLVVKTAAVPVIKNDKTNAYEYELNDLLRSVVFRLVFIKNYQQLEQLDLEDHQFKLTTEMKQLLKAFQFEDQYWFNQIKALNAPDIDHRDWEALTAYLEEVQQAVYQYKQQSSKLGSQLSDFKILYDDLIKLVNDANEDGLKTDAVQFNSQFDQNRFTHSLMTAYNQRLNWLFKDLGKFEQVDEDSDDLSNTDEVLPSLNSVEAGLVVLGNAIAKHQVNNEFCLAQGSSKIVERITKYLQKVIDSDQFEEHYQKLVDVSFNLDDLYLGAADLDLVNNIIGDSTKSLDDLFVGDDQAVTKVEKSNSRKQADPKQRAQLAGVFDDNQAGEKSTDELPNLLGLEGSSVDSDAKVAAADDEGDDDLLSFLDKKGDQG